MIQRLGKIIKLFFPKAIEHLTNPFQIRKLGTTDRCFLRVGHLTLSKISELQVEFGQKNRQIQCR